MSNVPWAPGRRALVWFPNSGMWRECCGDTIGSNEVWVSLDGENAVSARLDGVKTALLPNQCPRCFEVGTHADGCMVATNLARGMSAFWAPWVMETPPPVHVGGASVFQVHADRLEPMSNGVNPGWEPKWFVMGRPFADDNPDPNALGWLVLGPEGPTLAPWGKG